MSNSKSDISSKKGGGAATSDDYSIEDCKKNVARNFAIILEKTGWSKKVLSEEMEVAQATMTEYTRGDRLPSLSAVLRLRSNKEIQRRIPFTIDQFLMGDIRDGAVSFGDDFSWNQEDSVHKDTLGTYYLYFLDREMQETGGGPQIRKLRYGVFGLYETTRKSSGIKVLVFARFFKSEEEMQKFGKELEDCISATEKDRLDKEMSCFRSYDDLYTGSEIQLGNHIFIDLFSKCYNDKALIILTAPGKKPGADYIGGLGNILSVTHGSEHIPVSQKIILSRKIIEASDEEILNHLLYGNVKIDVDGELRALLDLLEMFYSPHKNDGYLERILDEADKRAIIRQRLQQLINNYVGRTYNGLCMVSKQDDHACYQFIKRHVKP